MSPYTAAQVREALEEQRVLCCGILRKLRGIYLLSGRDQDIAEEAARRLDATIDETLAALSAEPDICTCPDWTPGIAKVNAPLMLQYARNPHTTKGYDGPQFRFCPFCGGRAPE